MDKQTRTLLIVGIIMIIGYWAYTRRKDTKREFSEIEGCTDPDSANYDPDAVIDNGTCTPMVLGCCDPNAPNFDALCDSDPQCQCSQQACNLVSGRSACCDNTFNEFDSSCVGDIDCVCDNSLCVSGSTITGATPTSACCTVGAINYDGLCFSDPTCSCDNTLCNFSANSQTCYSNCIGSGSQSVYTTTPCGTGSMINFPNVAPPVCGGGSNSL